MKTKNYVSKNVFTTPILSALVFSGGKATVDDVAEIVWEYTSESLTYSDVNTILSGEISWRNRLRWHGARLKQQGYIKSSKRGVWEITPSGRASLKLFTDIS